MLIIIVIPKIYASKLRGDHHYEDGYMIRVSVVDPGRPMFLCFGLLKANSHGYTDKHYICYKQF